jgi:CRP-like cAMP-binding protein
MVFEESIFYSMELGKSRSRKRLQDSLPSIHSPRPYISPRYSLDQLDMSETKLQRLYERSARQDLEVKIFPEWLRKRKDFKSQYLSCLSFDHIDKFLICSKAASRRNRFEKESLVTWARSVPDISWMPKSLLSEVCDKLTPVTYEPREVLFRENDLSDCLLLIVKGSLEVWKDGHQISTVTKDNAIGEASLKTNSIRTATVIATTRVQALKLSKVNYDTIILRDRLQETREIAVFFQSTQFFESWNISRLERLAESSIVKQFEANQDIYRQGDTSHSFFVIKSGRVRLEAKISLSTVTRWPRGLHEWEERTKVSEVNKRVRVCGPGELFGEYEAGLGIAMKTSATALELTVIYIVLKEAYRAFRQNEMQIATQKPCRPDTAELIQEIKNEKSKRLRKSKALMDALETNVTPKGRDIFTSKKSKLLGKLVKAKRLKLV